MRRLRATIVAVLTLALAALPVAGVSMPAAASEAPAVSAHADCCPLGQPCAMQAMAGQAKSDHGHCGNHCGGNCLCLGLTAVLSSSTGALSVLMPLVKTARVAESASSLAYIPPAPPPRV
jgi:hypothetical protein